MKSVVRLFCHRNVLLGGTLRPESGISRSSNASKSRTFPQQATPLREPANSPPCPCTTGDPRLAEQRSGFRGALHQEGNMNYPHREPLSSASPVFPTFPAPSGSQALFNRYEDKACLFASPDPTRRRGRIRRGSSSHRPTQRQSGSNSSASASTMQRPSSRRFR